MPTWVRVRDKTTGHEYDVAPGAVRKDQHVVLEDYEQNASSTAEARPAKTRQPKGQAPTRRRQLPADVETASTETAPQPGRSEPGADETSA